MSLQSGTSVSSTVNLGTGTLTLGGNLYVGVSGTGATPVSLAGDVNLGASPREFNVAAAGTWPTEFRPLHLDISAVLGGVPKIPSSRS